MSKLVLIPNSISQIEEAKVYVDAYILPFKGLSVNFYKYFELEEIKEIVKKTDKEIFISINKNMHNSDLEDLENLLLELDKMDISGIMYYDIAVLNMHQRLNLHIPLVWNQEHFVTSSTSINYYLNEGVNYAYLSSEITLNEVEEIRKETKAKLFMNIFGYIPMFTSKRHLIKNYLKTFSLKDSSNINYISKENKIYPITDLDNTTVYSANILNGLEESLTLNIDYFVINSFNIESDSLIEVLKIFKTVNKENIGTLNNKINDMFKNIDKCFFYIETIYKVIK